MDILLLAGLTILGFFAGIGAANAFDANKEKFSFILKPIEQELKKRETERLRKEYELREEMRFKGFRRMFA